MKHFRITRRLLSLALTGALLLPSLAGVAPASAADISKTLDSTPISLNFTPGSGGKWTPTTAPAERVWLDIADNTAVVDTFSYTVTSDKGTGADRYAIDQYGYLTLKTGATPIEGETLTVTAGVSYYDGDDVIFADNVASTTKRFTEGGTADKGWKYTIADSSVVTPGQTSSLPQVARTGRYGITTESSVKNGAPRYVLPTATTGIITAWYYDALTKAEVEKKMDGSAATGSETQFGLHMNTPTTPSPAEGNPASYFMGVALISGKEALKGNESYIARKTSANTWATSGVARNEGWHKLVWEVTSSGIKMSIDGISVNEESTPTSISSISISNNKGSYENTKNFLYMQHFLDDISVVKTGAAAKSGTVSITIPVDYTAPVLNPPSISAQPADQKAAAGESSVFTVTAANPAEGTLSYQWYSCAQGGSNGVAIPDTNTSAKTATLTLTDLTAGISYYYCAVTNVNGPVNTRVAKLTVLTARPETPTAPSVNDDGSVIFAYSGNGTTDFRLTIYRGAEATAARTVDKTIALNNSNWANTNLLAELRALGEGTYFITAQRLGGADSLDSLISAKSSAVVLAKLNAPVIKGWQGSSITWEPVSGTKSYRVQLYKDGSVSGSAVTVSAPATSAALAATGSGSFTATVVAVADTATLKFDSAPSALSEVKSQALRLTVDGGLHRGETTRVFLEGDNIGIEDFIYSLSGVLADKVTIDPKTGEIAMKSGYTPQAGDTVTVEAQVKYYPSDKLLWTENMESPGSLIPADTVYSLSHSPAHSRAGRLAGTPAATVKNGMFSPNINNTGTLVFWYYDPATEEEMTRDYADQAKFGMMINDYPQLFLGVGIPSTTGDKGPEGSVNLTSAQRAEYRTTYTYRAYDSAVSTGRWYRTNIERTPGWHKFEIKVAAGGSTLFIDGKPVCQYGSETPVTVTGVKSITKAIFATNWGDKADMLPYVDGKHFIDDVYILAPSTTVSDLITETKSVTVSLLPTLYSFTTERGLFDLNEPVDLTVEVSPNLNDLTAVTLNGTPLASGQYSAVGKLLTVRKEALVGLTTGVHTLSLTLEGTAYPFPVDVVSSGRDYYVSFLSGDNSNDGLTSSTAWKTFAKLNATTFRPGDRIYLDAQSTWNEQLILRGNGSASRPILLTRYNENATHPRPVINGNGTVGTVPSYIVEGAHGGSYKFSGAVELWNSGYWEISWLEVTNLGTTSKNGNGRCGIMVMNEWAYEGDTTQQTKNFYGSRKDHVYITDCYVHDVNGLFQGASDINGVGGTKHSGGIIGYGYLADFQVERCRISKVDIEGIRTTLFHPQGTQNAASYPADLATNTVFRNNFIDKLHGDAMVIAGGVGSVMEYNVGTTLGRSYVSKKDNSNYVPGEEPVNLDTSKNFAAIWFMGCKNSLAQYNECYDTQYFTPNDGEAWDIDMQSDNCVYQYNYSHHNAGGCILFMNSGCTNNIFRYNLSIEDGGTDYNPHTLFFVVAGGSSSSNYPLVYNNIFTISEKVKALIDGSNRETKFLHFQNNIILAAEGITNRPKFYDATYPGTASGGTANKISGGEFTNNIIWPQSLYDSFAPDLTKGVLSERNQVIDPGLVSTDRTAIPVLAQAWLNAGKEGDVVGVILSDNNWFDENVNSVLGGYKLKQDSPAINAGVKVPYWPGVKAENRFPLTRDFFGNAIDEADPDWTPDIGIHEFSPSVPEGSFKVTFHKNGGDTEATPSALVVESGKTVAELPVAPTRPEYIFDGWNTREDGSGSAFTSETSVVANLTVYAQWKPLHYTYIVTFDKNGGDTEANPAAKAISEPATILGSLPAAPTRADYAFAGWNTKADGSGSVFTVSTKVTGSITVYAQWKPTGAFTVVYDRNGGDTEASPTFQIVAPPNTTVGTLPAAPTRDGYSFTGWNTEKFGTGAAFNANTTVTANFTVYAQWRVKTTEPTGPSETTGGSTTPKPTENPNISISSSEGGQAKSTLNKDGSTTYTFTAEAGRSLLYLRVNGLPVNAASYTVPKDAAASIVAIFGDSGTDHTQNYADTADLPDYQASAVNYVVGSGLFQGLSDGAFAPQSSMSRAMFATVAARLYGADTSKHTGSFSDVADGAWYAGSVAWTTEMGFTTGISATKFAPERGMTRQELVTLLYRLARKAGADMTVTGDLTAFSDAGNVAAWASDAMAWAVGLGLVKGRGDMLAPGGTITRVEAAIILERMSILLVKG